METVIVGTGMFVPDNLVTNDDLGRIMDTSHEWIASRSGVHERRLADAGTGASVLAIEAATSALADAGVDPRDVDALITATMTPDQFAPGIAGLVQEGLGLRECATYDLRQQCSGFLYGLDLADSLLTSSRADTVVVVGAEVHGGLLPWDDVSWEHVLGRSDQPPSSDQYLRNSRHRSWSVLFGDGAGAVVVRSCAGCSGGVLAATLHTRGEYFRLITVPGVGSKARPYVGSEQIARDDHLPVMNGQGLYRQSVRLMPEVVEAAAKKAGLGVDDIDLLVAHQANDRILDGVRKRLGFSENVVPSNIRRYGNTTAASIPILYHELRAEQRIEPGMVVCFVAFGAGAHYGALLYQEPREVTL